MRGFKYNTETFIERAREIHTDIDYDYSNVEYIHSQTKIIIVDPIYGEFHITPNNFLSNHIHPARSGLQPKTTASFIQEAKQQRTDINFDYSKVEYVNSYTKVTIIDPDYGEFDILPRFFLNTKRKARHPARCGKGKKKNTLTKDKLYSVLKTINEK